MIEVFLVAFGGNIDKRELTHSMFDHRTVAITPNSVELDLDIRFSPESAT
jgi:hypothetical protein